MRSVHLLLGSNLGNRAELLARARMMIENQVGIIVQKTIELSTEPWGYESTNEYLNQIVVVETELEPIDLLDTTQAIERAMGRTPRQGDTYEDRPIDIDILYYDHLTLTTPRLTIPHPAIPHRPFVIHLLDILSRQ